MSWPVACFFELDASHLAVVNMLGLGTILVLPLSGVPLLKLQEQGATIVLPSCACNLDHLRRDLCSKGGCAKIKNFGTARASRVKNGSIQRDFAVQKVKLQSCR